MLNRALWVRTLSDAKGLILGCAAVLLAFFWVSVWMLSMVQLVKLPKLLTEFLPSWMQGMVPIPIEAVGTYEGILSLSYMDPVVLFTLTVYAIARGSDIVSGQLDRGTLEMLLAQPLRRITVFVTHAAVTLGGAALLAAACLLGSFVGLSLVRLPDPVTTATFIPAAFNLFALTFFLAGLTSVVSSCQRYRWQTISWVGGFYIVELIVKIVSRSSPKLQWLAHWTFFGAFEPSVLATAKEDVLALSLRYNGILLAMGLAAYVLAALIFCRRDLPAPL
jgi:ABC-2 type transport system permease protein